MLLCTKVYEVSLRYSDLVANIGSNILNGLSVPIHYSVLI